VKIKVEGSCLDYVTAMRLWISDAKHCGCGLHLSALSCGFVQVAGVFKD
jgi:hypothetical protein